MQQPEPNLETLLTEVTHLRQEVARLSYDLDRKYTNLRQETASLKYQPPQPSVKPTLRVSLKRFFSRLFGRASEPASNSLRARVIADRNARIGAIIKPPGVGSTTGTSLGTAEIGLVATGDKTLNLTDINSSDPVGVYGFCESGNGIKGASKQMSGVIGTSVQGKGIEGLSYNSAGVYGESSNDNGVYGHSIEGIGVFAASDKGAPFHIKPGTQPVEFPYYSTPYGSDGPVLMSDVFHKTYKPAIGDMYVDTSGNLHIYNGTDWKQVVTV
jgi:hypothetical protein